MQYDVRGIPTLLLFKDGQVQATQIGAVGKAQLAQLIDKAALSRARRLPDAGVGAQPGRDSPPPGVASRRTPPTSLRATHAPVLVSPNPAPLQRLRRAAPPLIHSRDPARAPRALAA